MGNKHKKKERKKVKFIHLYLSFPFEMIEAIRDLGQSKDTSKEERRTYATRDNHRFLLHIAEDVGGQLPSSSTHTHIYTI